MQKKKNLSGSQRDLPVWNTHIVKSQKYYTYLTVANSHQKKHTVIRYILYSTSKDPSLLKMFSLVFLDGLLCMCVLFDIGLNKPTANCKHTLDRALKRMKSVLCMVLDIIVIIIIIDFLVFLLSFFFIK